MKEPEYISSRGETWLKTKDAIQSQSFPVMKVGRRVYAALVS